MCASSQSSIRRWQWLFFTLEALAVLSCSYGVALRILWHYDLAGHPFYTALYRVFDRMLRPTVCLFLVASLMLVFVSPFFMRSLGRTAMIAYVIGFTSLLCAALLWFWQG